MAWRGRKWRLDCLDNLKILLLTIKIYITYSPLLSQRKPIHTKRCRTNKRYKTILKLKISEILKVGNYSLEPHFNTIYYSLYHITDMSNFCLYPGGIHLRGASKLLICNAHICLQRIQFMKHLKCYLVQLINKILWLLKFPLRYSWTHKT